MKKLLILITLLLPLSSFLTACSNEENISKKTTKLDIYTTVYPLQYFAERIGGKYVQAHSIYPPGADEHTFEPSQRDMMDLADADLFFYIGLGLEGFVSKSASSLKSENVELVAAGEKLDVPELNAPHDDSEADSSHGDSADGMEEHDEHGDLDPHVWLDPVYSIQLASAIKESLIKKMPKHKSDFEKNFASLKQELQKLDQNFSETIKSADHKKVIVTHAAFGYWEKRYGLEQISISGLSSSNEPSQKELKNIIKVANKEEIKYILFEQNITSKLGEIVEKEIGAKPLQLHNLATLTEENVKDKENYFTLMNKNLDTLKTALNK